MVALISKATRQPLKLLHVIDGRNVVILLLLYLYIRNEFILQEVRAEAQSLYQNEPLSISYLKEAETILLDAGRDLRRIAITQTPKMSSAARNSIRMDDHALHEEVT